MLVNDNNISTTINAIPITNTRYTAENLLMCTIAFSTVVASTHYVIAEEEYPEIRIDIRNERIFVRVKIVYDIVYRSITTYQ